MSDPIHSPAHYTIHPVQPIEISRHLGFCLGNVVKYVLRAPYKGGQEDLHKALQYLQWEDEMPFKPVFSDWQQMSDAINRLTKCFLKPPVNDLAMLQAQFLLDLKSYSRAIWRSSSDADYKQATAARQRMSAGIHEMLKAAEYRHELQPR